MRFARATSSAAVSSLWRPTSARKSWRLSAAPETDSASKRDLATVSFSALRVRLDDLDGVGLELALQELGLVLPEVVLDDERLELGCLEMPAVLFGAFDECLQML